MILDYTSTVCGGYFCCFLLMWHNVYDGRLISGHSVLYFIFSYDKNHVMVLFVLHSGC
jgi:hypothetical protein